MAISFFLKLNEIPGESKDQGHADQIKLMSWSWGGSNAANIGGSAGASGGTVNLQDFSFSKETDKATPKLLKACTTGASISEGHIYGVKSTGGGEPETFVEWTLNEIYITSANIAGSSEAIPTESYSMAFAKVKTDYKKQNEDGTLTTAGEHTYDMRTKVTS